MVCVAIELTQTSYVFIAMCAVRNIRILTDVSDNKLNGTGIHDIKFCQSDKCSGYIYSLSLIHVK